MTARRLLAAVSLTAFATGGLFGFAAPASADDTLCIGGDNQRKPGSYQGICLGDVIDWRALCDTLGKTGN